MIFTAKEDIEAPLERVFAQLTDFATLERQALRRGGEIKRLDRLPMAERGAMWEIRFPYRGKRRELQAEITKFDPATGYVARLASPGLSGEWEVELISLARNRTRMSVRLSIRPETLGARLAIQTARLAKPQLSRAFANRMADYAKSVGPNAADA